MVDVFVVAVDKWYWLGEVWGLDLNIAEVVGWGFVGWAKYPWFVFGEVGY